MASTATFKFGFQISKSHGTTKGGGGSEALVVNKAIKDGGIAPWKDLNKEKRKDKEIR